MTGDSRVYDALLEDWKKNVARELVSGENSLRLAEFALDAAKVLAYPELEVAQVLSKIDLLGEAVMQKLRKSPTSPPRPTFVIEKINEQLFEAENFQPNIDDYYNPLNSYLNAVLERKKGIPITLSIIYLRVAHTVKFPMYPVSFPAHFLVKHVMEGENGEIIVDPFNRGRIMDDYSLKALLEQSFPHQNISLTRAFVEKATQAQVITRMLNNLKTSYSEAQDLEMYERANEMVLAIDPYNPDAVRDRGILLHKKGRSSEALAVLNSYLEIDPEADDADEVLDIIRQIRGQSG